MPIAVLGLFQAASLTRYVRSAVLDVIRLDYVTTARAKGLGERVVIVKHVVRNALIPVVTLVALQMPAIFGGAIVTEQIFRIPGIGSLLISSILANDTPVIMAVTFVFACLVVLFNLIADILYGWLDPRITLPLRPASPRRRAPRGTSRRGWRPGGASAAIGWRSSSGVDPARHRAGRPARARSSGACRSTRSTSPPASRARPGQHPFGTDDLGQDLLARMLYGGRISLAVGLAAMVVAIVVGTIVGAIAGMSRGGSTRR